MYFVFIHNTYMYTKKTFFFKQLQIVKIYQNITTDTHTA